MRNLLRQIRTRRDEGGQTLPMFVLFLVILILFVGLGIDLGFAYITRANLSKSVDAACLMGIRNLSQGSITASAVGSATFATNYGKPGRDAGDPTVQVQFSKDANQNIVLNVDATATINTFFIRVLPPWSTLTVSANAQAIRPKLILGLVLDRSGSMNSNGGAGDLPDAVGRFIDKFIEAHDRASMSSFAFHARDDVAMRPDFKGPIKSAANNLSFDGWTVSEQGLFKGWQQVRNEPVAVGEEVVKVIVFFTDGLANTFRYDNFVCGGVTRALNIAPNLTKYDPDTGDAVTCDTPACITSIKGGCVPTALDCNENTRATGMYDEAEKRAEAVAGQARADGIYVYAIGLGDVNSGYTECGKPTLNIPFLQQITNENGAADPNSPFKGAVAIAKNAGELDAAFEDIARKILMRLTR